MNFLNPQDVLHAVSQGLTIPVIVLLLIMIGYAIFTVGSLIVEVVVERRHFKVVMPELMRAIEEASAEDMTAQVKASGLLLRQKTALTTLFKNRDLPEEGRWALAKKLVSAEAAHYQAIVGRNEAISRVAPMFGLMGTLIPLGPGIVAMGQGQTDVLSNSLLIAFDTTVAGLVVGAVCYCVAKLRRAWYAEYEQTMEACVAAMLERIDVLGEEGASAGAASAGAASAGSAAASAAAADAAAATDAAAGEKADR